MPYDNELRFVLFRNDKATEANKQPQMRGEATIAGVKYKLSAWAKASEKAGKFLAGRIEAAEEDRRERTRERLPDDDRDASAQDAAADAEAAAKNGDDDGLPF